MNAGDFAAIAMTLYVAHHVGDYWVQTDQDAQHKGDAGQKGALHCLRHVLTYVATQTAALFALAVVTGAPMSWRGALAGLFVSGVTHYTADRREHGRMFWLAKKLPGKANFLKLGTPRPARVVKFHDPDQDVIITDNPSLGTGAWALDQSWHIFWGVFVAALLIVGLS